MLIDHQAAGAESSETRTKARAALVELLDAQAVTLGASMAAELHVRIPELAEPEVRQALEPEMAECCIEHLRELRRLLADDLPVEQAVVPVAARRFVLALVHRRISVAVMLRKYRVGQRILWPTLAGHLRETCGDGPELNGELELLGTMLFDYVDIVCGELTEVYGRERERWVRSAAAVRTETVAEILAGTPLDPEVASARLGHQLRGRHVALVLRRRTPAAPVSVTGDLEAAARTLVRAAGGADPLVVPAGASTAHAWISVGDDPDALLTALEEHDPPSDLALAIGNPGRGLEGFRSSHEEALRAAALAELRASGPAQPPVSSYRHVELLTILADDLPRARRFARRELADLAGDEPGVEALRETALAFLDHGGSHTAAAAALHLHKNTVYTRVRRAERLLGAPLEPGRLRLHLALHLAVALQRQVLDDAPAAGAEAA